MLRTFFAFQGRENDGDREGSEMQGREAHRQPRALRFRQAHVPWLVSNLGAAQADQESHLLDVLLGETQDVAHPLKFVDRRAAPVAVLKRVHGAALLAGLGFGTGGALPRMPAADERRLPRTAFSRPASAVALDAGFLL